MESVWLGPTTLTSARRRRQIDEAKAAVNRFDAKGENLRRDAEKKIEQYKGEINRDVHVAAEKFDRTVEQGAEKAKSTWKIWFGGK